MKRGACYMELLVMILLLLRHFEEGVRSKSLLVNLDKCWRLLLISSSIGFSKCDIIAVPPRSVSKPFMYNVSTILGLNTADIVWVILWHKVSDRGSHLG